MFIDRHFLHSFVAAARAEDAAAATGATGATTLVGWMANPNTRGTAAILYSCMSVLILCSYKCHHPPIPESVYRYARAIRVWGCLPLIPDPLTVHMQLMNLRDLISLIILPEVGVATALTEYAMARQILHDVRGGSGSGAGNDGNEASARTNSWLRFSYKPLGRRAPPWTEHEMNSGLWHGLSLAHAFYAQMGGIMRVNKVHGADEKMPADGKPLSLHEYVMFLRLSPYAVRKKYFLREGDIDALAKADIVSKFLALMQSTWLLVTTIARHAQHLPITPLELSTCAYVLCAAAMYTLWWHKPYGALQRLVVYEYDEEMHRRITEMYAEVNEGPAEDSRGVADTGVGVVDTEEGVVDASQDAVTTKEAMPNTNESTVANITLPEHTTAPYPDKYTMTPSNLNPEPSLLHHPPKQNWNSVHNLDDTLHHDGVDRFTHLMTWNVGSHHTSPAPTALFYTTTLIFGAVHLLAWSWQFPSHTARTVWRVLAVICTATPVVVMLLPVLFCVAPLSRFHGFLAKVAVAGLFVAIPVYVIARVMTLILAFYCLKASPKGTYLEVQWTSYLPSIA